VPTLIVVHNISLPPNEFGGTAIAELFQNTLDCDAHPYYDTHLRGVRVSAHFVIHRDGALEQFVSCNERAWHAGPSAAMISRSASSWRAVTRLLSKRRNTARSAHW
jgi:AmpD protein